MPKKLEIIFVAGARPNFMKIAPLIAEAKKHKNIQSLLVHTGQHYDEKMSRVFFDELKIPKPDINLEIGSGTHAEQTGKIMIKFDAVLEKLRPDLVVVVGDVNSTIACSLAAKKRGIKIAHVEAGLRSFDWTMPEEINRVLTDRISDFLFCTEENAVKNLKKEGVDPKKIFFVGNVMIDTLLAQKKHAEESKILQNFGLIGKKYALATLHRPSNVDNPKMLKKIIKILEKIANLQDSQAIKMPIIFPIHPRTQKNLERWGIKTEKIRLIEPVGYLDFLALMSRATVVLTDSGGIQEETTILGVPCLTLRENTERPVTVSEGTNKIVGSSEEKVVKYVSAILKNARALKVKKPPKFWDGRAAQRIIKIISENL